MLHNKLGRQVKYYREQRGLSQQQLAEKTGISTLHIGYIEQGRRHPQVKTLEKIANALGIAVRDLFTF